VLPGQQHGCESFLFAAEVIEKMGGQRGEGVGQAGPRAGGMSVVQLPRGRLDLVEELGG
jgi:hypothetical protein